MFSAFHSALPHRRLGPFHCFQPSVLFRSSAAILSLTAVLSLSGCAHDEPEVRTTAKRESPDPPAPRTQGTDWPAFLGPQGDGTSTETGIDPQRWAPHPPIAWTLKLGTSYGAPTISQGRLFQFDRFGDRERLTCYEATTGKELWRSEAAIEYDDQYGYNNGPRCSPVVDGDRVYTYGVAGELACRDIADGKLHWTKNLLQEYNVVPNFFGVGSTPCVFEDLLLVMVGGSPAESKPDPSTQMAVTQSNGTAIVAFDKKTGQEKYRVGDDLASYASLTVRHINGEPTGLAFLRSGLLAWEPSQGSPLFQFPWRADIFESVNAAVPITTDNRILLSETYEIGSVLLEITDHQPEIVWKDGRVRREQSFRAHWSTPVLIDGYLYGCSGRNQPDSDFRCIRFSDGEVQWLDRRHERSSVLLADGYLIVLGEYGRLELVRPNPEKLEVVREVELSEVELSEVVDADDQRPLLGYPCWAAPILSHGLLYVRGRDRLVCFDLIPESNHEER